MKQPPFAPSSTGCEADPINIRAGRNKKTQRFVSLPLSSYTDFVVGSYLLFPLLSAASAFFLSSRKSDILSSGGVTNVVTITIITTAE